MIRCRSQAAKDKKQTSHDHMTLSQVSLTKPSVNIFIYFSTLCMCFAIYGGCGCGYMQISCAENGLNNLEPVYIDQHVNMKKMYLIISMEMLGCVF